MADSLSKGSVVVSQYAYKPRDGYKMSSRKDDVERNGYQSRRAMIRNLILSGQKLEAIREQQYWDYFEQEAGIVVSEDGLTFSDMRFGKDLIDIETAGEAATRTVQQAEEASLKRKENYVKSREERVKERAALLNRIESLEKKSLTENPRL